MNDFLLAISLDLPEWLSTVAGGAGLLAGGSLLPKLLDKLKGGVKPDAKPDSLADLLQIGGMRANADALKKFLEAISAQGFPTKLVLDAEFASGDPVHVEFSRVKREPAK